MAVIREEIIEWEPQIREIDKENIFKEDYKSVKIVQEEKVRSSLRKKLIELIKNKEGLGYAIIVNLLILIGSIIVVVSFIMIGGLLANPILIFGALIMFLLFSLMEVLKLAEKQTNCKKSS